MESGKRNRKKKERKVRHVLYKGKRVRKGLWE